MKIDSVLLSSVRSKMDLALSKIGEELSIELKAGNASYTDSSATMTVNINVKGYCKYAADWDRVTTGLGWSEGVFDRFECGEIYEHHSFGEVELLGAKARARKYPFIIKEVSSGNRYKLTFTGLQALKGPIHGC